MIKAKPVRIVKDFTNRFHDQGLWKSCCGNLSEDTNRRTLKDPLLLIGHNARLFRRDQLVGDTTPLYLARNKRSHKVNQI